MWTYTNKLITEDPGEETPSEGAVHTGPEPVTDPGTVGPLMSKHCS